MRVLLTRPEPRSREIAALLGAEGIEALIWPLTRVSFRETPLEPPAGTEALLFTSANGVRAFAALSARRDLPALCVGDATAEAARAAGFADVRSAAGDAAALARLALASGYRRFFHPRGARVAGDLAGTLGAAGCSLAAEVVYRTEEADPPPPEVAAALRAGTVDLVTVWSPANARILARRLAELTAPLGGSTLLAISEAAAAPLAGAGFGRVLIAPTPSRQAMLAAIRETAHTGRSGTR